MARLFWHEQFDSAVLVACASRVEHASPTAFDLDRFASFACILCDGSTERFSLSDGFHRVRIDILDGTVLAGPVRLRFLVTDDERASVQILALQQFHALRRRGVFGRSLHPPEPHAAHWIRQLRAFDAVESGASERVVAMTLFAGRFSDEGWRTGEKGVRSAARRLIATARRMVAGDYLKLLR